MTGADTVPADTVERAAATAGLPQPYAELGLKQDEYEKIAGICSADGNVVGLMPHPEHAIDPLTGPSVGGLGFFTSIVRAFSGEPSLGAGQAAGLGARGA